MKKEIILVDACQFSPNYNNCLLEALVNRGEKIIYATTKFPHAESPIPEQVKVRYCYFYLARMLERITSSNFLRRLLRIIEYPFDSFALVAYVLLNRIKLVHYMWLVLPTLDVVVMQILKLVGCRVIYTAHNPFPHELKKSHMKKLSRIYKQVDHIIALTNFTRTKIVEHAKIPAEKISVIPHGNFDYVLSQYPCNQALAEKVRGLANSRHVISFLGLIRPYKGLEYFVRAFSIIKRLKPNTFFLVAGGIRFANKKRLFELLSKYYHPKDCYVDLRYLPLSDMKAHLSVTDVLVQPYTSASQSGNTVMAYSAGIPVVCSDIGGLPEMIKIGQTGYIVPPKDPQAIADAVCKCLENENLSRMAKAARHLAATRYNWKNIASRVSQVYHQQYEIAQRS